MYKFTFSNLIGAVVPGTEESSQDTAQTFAAVSTVVGKVAKLQIPWMKVYF